MSKVCGQKNRFSFEHEESPFASFPEKAVVQNKTQLLGRSYFPKLGFFKKKMFMELEVSPSLEPLKSMGHKLLMIDLYNGF